MNNDLIDRYVHAVKKYLPYKIREEVGKEIHVLINDMLEERCGNNPVTQQDIQVVLTELGTPMQLAEKYMPEGPTALISYPYYQPYLLVCTVVVCCVLASAVISGVVGLFFPLERGAWQVMSLVWSVLSGIPYAIGIITIVFAIMQYKKVDVSSIPNIAGFSLNDLPSVPKGKNRIPVGESVAGIVFDILFLVLCLSPLTSMFAYRLTSNNTTIAISILNIPYLQSVWYLLVGSFALGILQEVVKLVDGRYSTRVLLSSIVTSVGSVALLFIVFAAGSPFNPNFWAEISKMLPPDITFFKVFGFAVFDIFSKWNFFALICFFELVEVVTCFVKWLKYERLAIQE